MKQALASDDLAYVCPLICIGLIELCSQAQQLVERIVKAKHKWLTKADIKDLPTVKAEFGSIRVILPVQILADVTRCLMKQIIYLSKDELLPSPEYDVWPDLLKGWEKTKGVLELLGHEGPENFSLVGESRLSQASVSNDDMNSKTKLKCATCGWMTSAEMLWGHHTHNFCELYKGARNAGNDEPHVKTISKNLGTQPGHTLVR